jgi:hypothetical protein
VIHQGGIQGKGHDKNFSVPELKKGPPYEGMALGFYQGLLLGGRHKGDIPVFPKIKHIIIPENILKPLQVYTQGYPAKTAGQYVTASGIPGLIRMFRGICSSAFLDFRGSCGPVVFADIAPVILGMNKTGYKKKTP